MEIPELRFAQARGGRVAFQQWGEGVDIVSVPPLAQNIEASWGHPIVVAMLERFGRIGRYTHYDKRGTGASDRISRPPTHDERVDDMRAVMDEAGVERAWLMGNSDGGPTALLFAAAYPERVLGVILFGSGVSSVPAIPPEDMDAVLVRQREVAQLWGTADSPWLDAFAPSLAGDQGFRDWYVRYQRTCCDSQTLYDLIVMSIGTDVTEILPQVHCPVVALHRTDDPIVPIHLARRAVDGLPDARLVEFPGNDHFGFAGDMDAWLDVMEEVVTGTVAPPVAAPAAAPTVAVRTLGRFAVEVDGEEVPTSAWGSRHARTVVKRLAAARGWPVRREELFELLWPDEADRAKVGARLSVQLSTVRRILRGGLVADRETVRLDPKEVELDLVAFDRATDDQAILAAYGGPFLADDPDLDWAAATRAEVQARFAAAADRVARHWLDRGRAGRAARVARRMVEADAHDLRGHELLVQALLETEQQGALEDAHAGWVAAGEAVGIRVPPLDPA